VKPERIRSEVERSLLTSVEQGIGEWPTSETPDDPEYGAPLYEYSGGLCRLTLFEAGVQDVSQQAVVRVAYADVCRVVTLRLTELVRVSRNPEAMVDLVLQRADASLRLPMPLKVYSTVSTLLIRLTKQEE
jgi:hypothetical protein